MSPHNPQFDKLKAKWYAKLKKEGFEDIEQNEDYLKDYTSSHFYRGRNKGKDFDTVKFAMEQREEYYRLAGQFLHDYKFEDKTHKFIWEKHSEGISFTKIPALLKRRGIKKERHWVWCVIDRLRAVMLDRLNNHEQE